MWRGWALVLLASSYCRTSLRPSAMRGWSFASELQLLPVCIVSHAVACARVRCSRFEWPCTRLFLCRRSRARIIISSSVSAMFDLDRISIGGPSGLWSSRDVVAMTSLNCTHLNRSSDIVAPVQRGNRANFNTLYVWFPEPSPCWIPFIAVKH